MIVIISGTPLTSWERWMLIAWIVLAVAAVIGALHALWVTRDWPRRRR